MEATKKEIVICLGSSCFARGNRQFLHVINEYLKEKNLVGEVQFHGQRCFGNCSAGPTLRLGNELIEPGHNDAELQFACIKASFESFSHCLFPLLPL